MLIMSPIILNLYFKTYTGVRWIFKGKGFTRTALQTYYLNSWVFYTCYFVQAIFILCFTWKVFNDHIRIIATISIAICFPFWFILSYYMNWIDQQNFALNFIRKKAIQERKKSQLILKLDQTNRPASQSEHLVRSKNKPNPTTD